VTTRPPSPCAARLAELFAAAGPATPTPTTHPQHAPDGEENP
jgi:hypothetical protein